MPSSGRQNGGLSATMPAMERGPDPRPRPSSTVSAWSSRVWARAMRAPPSTAARRAAERDGGGAASGPPSRPTSTRTTVTGSSPRLRNSSAVRSARAAEPAWSPWSTVTAPAGRPARGASNAIAAASARESAPPLHATRTGWSEALRVGRTALRIRATAGSGPATELLCGDGGTAEHPLHPPLGGGQLLEAGQVGRALPDAVETLHADQVDDPADEDPALRVLLHLLLEPEEAAEHAVERSTALAALGEPLAQRLHGRHDVRPDAVHHVLGVPLHQAHHRGDAVEDGPLRGVLDEGHEPLGVVVAAADGVDDPAQHLLQPVTEDVGAQVGGLDE